VSFFVIITSGIPFSTDILNLVKKLSIFASIPVDAFTEYGLTKLSKSKNMKPNQALEVSDKKPLNLINMK